MRSAEEKTEDVRRKTRCLVLEKVPATYAGLKARHNRSLNGLGDSFWVDAKIIEELRPKMDN